jgi:hypothetical protein
MGKSLISQELIDAYTATSYVVECQPEFTLRVGNHSEALASLYATTGVNTACFITAYNPFSVLLTTPHNVARQAELLNDLAGLKLKFVFGYGQGKDSDWREASVLVLGITHEESMRLAVKHEQNAFIWCDEEATPKLVLTR